MLQDGQKHSSFVKGFEMKRSDAASNGKGVGAAYMQDSDFLLDYVEEDQGSKELQGLTHALS